MPQITIVDYGMGNLRSVAKAFEAIGCRARVTQRPEDVDGADALVLPGVGAFGDGMANLRRLGLIPLLRQKVVQQKIPFLGICLGMQLLGDEGSEDGRHEGLGWIQGKTLKLDPGDKSLKVPHMGWNDVRVEKPGPLWAHMEGAPCFYFLHSYHLLCADIAALAATCDYGGKFTAAVEQENIFGTQFHPEKSQTHGLQLLRNFAAMVKPCP